jgi:hypothetical protein
MIRFLLALSLALLVCAGCEKKEPKPVVAADAEDPSPTQKAPLTERADAALRNLGEKTLEAATEIKGGGVRRDEGKFSALKAELEKNGRVIRDKVVSPEQSAAPAADSAQIVAAVKSKLVADREIFASKIQVNADQGIVTLTGSVGSSALLSRAIQLALETEGVNRVVSLLTIDV